jgi:hypothetical protein
MSATGKYGIQRVYAGVAAHDVKRVGSVGFLIQRERIRVMLWLIVECCIFFFFNTQIDKRSLLIHRSSSIPIASE